ncbi:hypothetical protein [uncultured Aeromicrobium sp.]|uniref:hypothetical protein n=1 Tax=uncultured Aeromicrobium sp. TaxID=337820 RepID=UPI0025F3DC7A|nr:hypothetical protein [uncultured Aeromicrobium sp.]
MLVAPAYDLDTALEIIDEADTDRFIDGDASCAWIPGGDGAITICDYPQASDLEFNGEGADEVDHGDAPDREPASDLAAAAERAEGEGLSVHLVDDRLLVAGSGAEEVAKVAESVDRGLLELYEEHQGC